MYLKKKYHLDYGVFFIYKGNNLNNKHVGTATK